MTHAANGLQIPLRLPQAGTDRRQQVHNRRKGHALDFDAQGRLYIADTGNERIEVFNAV